MLSLELAEWSMCLFLTLAAQESWHVHHMDVKSAYINNDSKEEMYVHEPSKFFIPGPENKVLHLCKALYGLQQAPWTWNIKLDATLKCMGFNLCPHEAAIYRPGNNGYALLVGIYVDGLVMTGAKDDEVEAFEVEMKAVFPDERSRASFLLLGDRGAPG